MWPWLTVAVPWFHRTDYILIRSTDLLYPGESGHDAAPSCDLFCLLLCFFGSRGRGHDLRLASWVLSKLPKYAVLVGSRLRRSTLARACTPLTKSEEKERLFAVQLFSATILSCIPSNTDSAALVLKASNSEKLTPHLLATWTVYSSFNTNYAQMLAWTLILIYICIWTLHRY